MRSVPGATSYSGGRSQSGRIRTKGAPPIGWATDDGIAVTIQSYDGRQIKGTFSGVFEHPGEFNPTEAPAPIEAGKSSLPMLGG